MGRIQQLSFAQSLKESIWQNFPQIHRLWSNNFHS